MTCALVLDQLVRPGADRGLDRTVLRAAGEPSWRRDPQDRKPIGQDGVDRPGRDVDGVVIDLGDAAPGRPQPSRPSPGLDWSNAALMVVTTASALNGSPLWNLIPAGA